MLTRAGVDPTELAAAVTAEQDVARIEELLPAARKLVELLNETYLVKRHLIAALLADASAQTKRRAKRDPNGDELRAALEPLLTYAGAPSKKATATKKSKKAKVPPPAITPAPVGP
jgi:hypothetical protein